MSIPDSPSYHLGWQLVDPGPPPRTQRLEQIPSAPDRARLLDLHDAWQEQCEKEDRALADQHANSATVWYPVQREAGFHVVPFFGGTPRTWQAAVASLTQSLVRNGYTTVRVADLSRVGALDLLNKLMAVADPGWAAQHVTVSPSGSSVDVFEMPTTELLAATVADILRATSNQGGLVDATRTKQALLDLATRLDTTHPGLKELADAATLALTGRPRSGSSFSIGERSRLQDYHDDINQRAFLKGMIDNLEPALRFLARFGPAPGMPVTLLGTGPVRVRSASIVKTGSTTDFELGQQLLGRFVTRQFARPAASGPDALILLGADSLPPDALQTLLDSAQMGQRQLLLFFERISGQGQTVLGSWGSNHAVFFRLGHPDDRKYASVFLGSAYKFVVSGYSLSVTEGTEWNESNSFSSDQTVTRTRVFGTFLGDSLAHAIGKTRQATTGTGGSTTAGTTTNFSRVNEPLLEPEVFQQIPDTTMLIVSGNRVVVGDCNPRIRALPITSAHPWPGSA